LGYPKVTELLRRLERLAAVVGDSAAGSGCDYQRNRGTPITDEMINLRAFVEPPAADPLRKAIGFAAERLLELE
jgi:hypothetical protein